jgi:hypothetical protein
MRKLYFVIIFILFGTIIYSQETSLISKTSSEHDNIKHVIHNDISTLVFIAFYSFNYEYTIKQNPDRRILRLRTGLFYTFDSYSYGIPICLTSLFGKNNKYFELTTGIVPRILKGYQKDGFGLSGYFYYEYSIYPVIDIGYRHEPGKGKLFYRFKIGSSGLGFGIGYLL